VSNPSRIYSLVPEERNRLGTIYIVTYFAGGLLGTAGSVWSWTHYGWSGVCIISALLLLVSTLYWGFTARRYAALRS
tara:strand:+ start:24529 stop:24759 length:231 start_codon:yes stop_codon:yes gene_type:complete